MYDDHFADIGRPRRRGDQITPLFVAAAYDRLWCKAGQLKFFGQHAHLADRKAFAAYLAPLRSRKWYVYSKPPFGGPEAVLAYLSRYTHRVAISNRRLIAFDQNGVTFRYKDYRADGRARYKLMTLATDEFIRRFLSHVLPKGSTASATTACSPRPPVPTTSRGRANCSLAQSPNASRPMLMSPLPTTPRPPVHAAAAA